MFDQIILLHALNKASRTRGKAMDFVLPSPSIKIVPNGVTYHQNGVKWVISQASINE